MKISIELDTNDSPQALKVFFGQVVAMFGDFSHDTDSTKGRPAPAATETAKDETAAETTKAKPGRKPKAEKVEAPEPAATPAAPAPEIPPAAPAESGGISLDNIRDAVIKLVKSVGPKDAVALVQATANVSKAKDVDPSKYQALMSAIDDAIAAKEIAG